jgi:uncharacterized protein YdhG (YjbR/CyaY superfamily)
MTVTQYDLHMATGDGDRSKFFPAIEKKHGGPISIWIDRLRELGDAKYPEQIAFLRENHGFSQAHANALVMYVRGSTSSKRFDTPAAYFKTLEPPTAKKIKEIFSSITSAYSDLQLVMAWNQPMLKLGDQYILGISVSKNHLTIAPFNTDFVETFAKKLEKYESNKKTFKVPFDWKVDGALMRAIVKDRLAELS